MKRSKKRAPAVPDCGGDRGNESAGPALAMPVTGIDC